MLLIKTGPDNKPVFEKEVAITEIPVHINALISGGQNQMISLFTFEDHQTLYWINTLNGEVLTSFRVPFGIKIDKILTDRKNNMLMVACNGEIIVIKNNGLVF